MVTLDLKGFDEIQKNLDKLSADLQAEVSGILERGAQTFVRNAKRDAPVDHGVLRNEISYFPVAPLAFEVASNAYYSPYLEWGTITKVNVPEELVDYASQFKGKGIRKTGGIYPHPFFFKQIGPVQKQIDTDLQTFINTVKL